MAYPARLFSRRLLTTQPWNPDDGEDTRRLLRRVVQPAGLDPETGAIWERPREIEPEERGGEFVPRWLRPVRDALPVPVTDPDPQPVLTRSFPTPPPAPPDMGTLPLTRTDQRGRPQILPGFENDLDAQRQLRGNILTYQPQRRMGWKDFGLSALTGFLRGGLPGAAASSLHRLARPTFEDEQWQQQQLGQTNQNIDQILQERRAGLQDRLLNSQVAENEAQTEAARRRAAQPPRPVLNREQLPSGEVVLTELNPETGQFEPALRDGQPVILSRPKPERRVTVQTPDGPLLVSPEAALGYYGAVQGRGEAGVRRGEERESQALAAQDELDQLTADEANAGEQKNAAYAYLDQLKSRYNQLLANPRTSVEELQRLEDDIREATRNAETANSFYRSFGQKKTAAQAKVKRYSTPLSRPGSGSRTSGATSTPPPPPGVTEASVRAEARRRGQSEDEAVRRAKSFGWIP